MSVRSALRGRGQVATVGLLTFGLWVVIGFCALGVVAIWLRPAPKAPAVKVPPSSTAAEGAAELYVSAWIRAGQVDDAGLRSWYTAGADLRDVVPGTFRSVRTVTVGTPVEIKRGYWSVVVAAETVSEQGTMATRFYQVPMQNVGANWTAAALPSPVAGPVGVSSPRPLILLGRVDPSDDLASSVQSFLSAMLTGTGDLTRYVTPDASIDPVIPAPYIRVDLRAIGTRNSDDGHREVLAESLTVDAAARTQIIQTSLDVTRRDGLWVVSGILPGPTLEPRRAEEPKPLATIATTTTTQPASTTTTRPGSTTTRPV